MKNFKHVSDTELLSQIRLDAAHERAAGLAVIHQLREISRRRLYAKLRYDSLFVFCTEDLKYSSGSAFRRIRAMRALEDIPELEAQMESGELTLANASQVQDFCEKYQKSLEEKKAIFSQTQGLSKRATERKLGVLAPQAPRPDKLKAVNEEKSELRVTLDHKTVALLDQVRDLIAHAHPGATYAQAIEYLAKLGLKKLDPTLKNGRAPKVSSPGNPVSASTKSEVWKRDCSKCTYKAEDGKACGSTAFLQIDHIILKSKGGSNHPSNLRLRCQSHNLLTAIQELGRKKMEPYLTRGVS